MVRLCSLLRIITLSAMASVPMGGCAMAQSLDFSYTFGNGSVLSGVFTGTDAGNDFTVLSVQSILLNGTNLTDEFAGSTLESVDAFAQFGAGLNGNGTAVVTLDGSYQDLYFSNGRGQGLIFAVGDEVSMSFGNFLEIENGVSAGGDDGPYVQSKWTATIQGAAVPEPASLAVVIAGLAVIGYANRRRAL
jgi:hypothetical protein